MNKKLILILAISLTIFLMISTVSAKNMLDFYNSDNQTQQTQRINS